MKFSEGYKLVKKAYEQHDKEKWFRVWLELKPAENERLIPYETWYNTLLEQTQDEEYSSNLSKEDILQHANKIRERKVDR